MHVVSSSLCLCKNNACARICSIHRGWFFASVSNTIYISSSLLLELGLTNIFIVPACQDWNQVHSALTWLLIVFWGTEIMPFAWCLWDFDIFLLASSTSRIPWLGTDRSRSQVGSSGNCWYTWLEEMLDIYLYYWQIEVIKKIKGLTRSCTAIEWMCDRAAHSRPWIYYSRSDLAICIHLLMYNIWVHEAYVVDPVLPVFLRFHPARLQIKGGDEKAKRLSRVRV